MKRRSFSRLRLPMVHREVTVASLLKIKIPLMDATS